MNCVLCCILCNEQIGIDHRCKSLAFFSPFDNHTQIASAILALQRRVIKLETETRAVTLALGLPIPPLPQL